MIYVNEGMCIYFYTIAATFCCINKKEVYIATYISLCKICVRLNVVKNKKTVEINVESYIRLLTKNI